MKSFVSLFTILFYMQKFGHLIKLDLMNDGRKENQTSKIHIYCLRELQFMF